MENALQKVLNVIEQADDVEIGKIMAAVQKRCRNRYPDWDVLYIACPKNDAAQRQRTVEFMIRYFQTDK